MKRIIIASHASLAKGFCDALKLITGETENIYYINAFTDNFNPQEDLVSLLDSFSSDDSIFVLTELMGGSVNQFVSLLARERHFTLITGINLGLVLEIALKDEESLTDEAIREIIKKCRCDLTLMNDEFTALDAENQNEDEFFE